MRGAGVHFAPSGAAGMLIFQFGSFFTSIVNARERPSGAQLRLAGVSLTRVTCDVAPSAAIRRPAGVGTLHEEAIAGAVGVHDPQGRVPTVLDLVDPAPRVKDLRPVRRHLWIAHLLPVEIMVYGEQCVRGGFLRPRERGSEEQGEHGNQTSHRSSLRASER